MHMLKNEELVFSLTLNCIKNSIFVIFFSSFIFFLSVGKVSKGNKEKKGFQMVGQSKLGGIFL